MTGRKRKRRDAVWLFLSETEGCALIMRGTGQAEGIERGGKYNKRGVQRTVGVVMPPDELIGLVFGLVRSLLPHVKKCESCKEQLTEFIVDASGAVMEPLNKETLN